MGAPLEWLRGDCDAPGTYVLQEEPMPAANSLLTGKVGLVVGVANEQSIAAGCAQAFRTAGPNWYLPI